MSDAVKAYQEYSKTDLLRAYKEFLRQNERWRKKRDGFKHRGNGLERPSINDVVHSWKEFSLLPKDVIIVHTYMEGCDAKFLISLVESGFFTIDKKDIQPWKTEGVDYKEWLWEHDRAKAIKWHPYHWGYTRYGDGKLFKGGVGTGQFDYNHARRREFELDIYNPNRLYGPKYRLWLETKDTDWREEE